MKRLQKQMIIQEMRQMLEMDKKDEFNEQSLKPNLFIDYSEEPSRESKTGNLLN